MREQYSSKLIQRRCQRSVKNTKFLVSWCLGGNATLALLIACALVLISAAQPALAEAAPCAGEVLMVPAAGPRAQVFTDTLQSATNLFVCRVDGAGALASTPSAGTREVTPAGLLLLIVARWLHFLGYALGFGLIAYSLWAGGERGMYSRGWRLVTIGMALLLCAEPLALLAQTIGVGGALFDIAVAGDVLASGFGLVWAQRLGAAVLLWVIVGAVKDGTARAIWAALPLGLVLALIDASAGAAGARVPIFNIAAAVLHEAAMGVWLGGLALLLSQHSQLVGEQRTLLLMRFGRFSASAIGVLAITGILLAGTRLTQFTDLFASLYGAILIVKLLAALGAIGLALLGPPLSRALWRGRAILATLMVVLGVASLLVSVPAP